MVLVSLLLYQSMLSSYPMETRNIELLDQAAYVVLAMVSAGVCLSLAGATCYFRLSSQKNGSTKSSRTEIVLSLILNDKRSFRVFVLASLVYGIFFAFVSSFLVYEPLGGFSATYGVNVPSMLPVICCGSLGQMPQFVVYLTQQFAILIVPVNLILLFGVSWLVGLNVAIATYSYKNRLSKVRSNWFGGFGAIVGLFTACPTCAGFFFLTMLGLAGAVTFALTLSYLQAVFTAVGLPMLLLTPIVTARKVPSEWATSCAFVGNKEANRK
jgi:hypothetical protein